MKAPRASLHSFTLIEMLVSVSIMSLMLLMMAQVTGVMQQAWRMQQNRIDNFAKARSMVDLITDDLQRAVIRGDLPIFGTGGPTATPSSTSGGLYYFTGTAFTNAFYTRMPGVPDTASTQVRDLSLVSYVLATTNSADRITLQRSDLAVPWTSDQNVSFQGDMSTLLANATSRGVAPGVVGFHFAFRRADGTLVDQSQYSGFDAINPVVAVDVAVAVIGTQYLAQLSDGQIASIQNALNAPFTAPPATMTSIKAIWDQQVLTASFYASYPKGLGASLKTFERWVACPPF